MNALDRLAASRAARALISLERQRQRWARRVPEGPLRDYYRAPFPSPDTVLEDVPMLALDLETTGLVPGRDRILSIGYVPLDGGRIRLAGAGHLAVRTNAPIPEAAVAVHGITDDRARSGATLAEALVPTLAALTGRVLLAHFAWLETRFLDIACRTAFGGPLVVPVIDTLALERRRLARAGAQAPPGALRLGALRERHGLPRYRAHDALTDAVATAELLAAQLAERGGTPPRLHDVMERVRIG